MKKVLIIPDQHFPYNNKTYWDLLMKVGRWWKPDVVVILGDFIDNYSISSHDKDPNRQFNLGKEIEEARKGLNDVIKLGAKENVFICGNHEDRLERHLKQFAPQIYTALTADGKEPTDEMIGISKMGFKYIKYRDDYKIGKMYFTHDVDGIAGKYAHYRAVDTYHRNIGIGHTHQVGMVINGDADGDKHIALMFGWGGDANKIDYMHKESVIKNWCLAFGIMYVDETTQHIYPQVIPIVGYRCVVEGKLFDVI